MKLSRELTNEWSGTGHPDAWRVVWTGLRNYAAGTVQALPAALAETVRANLDGWQVTACDNPACRSAHCDDSQCRLTTQLARSEARRELVAHRAARRIHSGAVLASRDADSVRATLPDPFGIGGQHASRVRKSNTGRTSVEVLRRGWVPVTGDTGAPISGAVACVEVSRMLAALECEQNYRNAQRSVARAQTPETLAAAQERLTLARRARFPRRERMRLASVGMAIASEGVRRRMVTDRFAASHAGDIARVSVLAVELGVLAPAGGSDTVQGSGARFAGPQDRRGETVLTSVDGARYRKLEAVTQPAADAPAAHHAFGVVPVFAGASVPGHVYHGFRLVPEIPGRAYNVKDERTVDTPEPHHIGNAVVALEQGKRLSVAGHGFKVTVTVPKSGGAVSVSVKLAGDRKATRRQFRNRASAATFVESMLSA